MKIVNLIGIIAVSLLFQACSSVEETVQVVVDETVDTTEQSGVTTQAVGQLLAKGFILSNPPNRRKFSYFFN